MGPSMPARLQGVTCREEGKGQWGVTSVSCPPPPWVAAPEAVLVRLKMGQRPIKRKYVLLLFKTYYRYFILLL